MEILSPLCCRHDGAVLGLFLFLSRFDFARERFPVLRRRMQQFLDSINAGVVLPAEHADLKSDFTTPYQQILDALALKDRDAKVHLFRSFALGFGFLSMALKMPGQTHPKTLQAIMKDMSLPYSLLEEHAARVPEIGDKTPVEDLMTPALAFVRDILLPLQVEPETCFVAMPFSDPFEGYYPEIYQPIMRGAGYRTLRAWGGLAAEYHLELLVTLIEKSGAVMVELTGLNPNVVFELGYAYGRDKVVIPLGDAARPIALANLHGLAILPYDSAKADWRNEFLNGLSRRILQAMLTAAKGNPIAGSPATS